VDPGIPARDTTEILQAHDALVGKIKLCYGADRTTFERDIMVLIRNYAAFVNLLPATPDNYFAGPGGLFRLGLETAFFALQGTDGHIVSGRSTITERRRLEPRWRHATFIAGLCAELHRTLNQLIVTDEKGHEWPAYLMPLTLWLRQQHASRLFVRWLPNAQQSRSLAVFALPFIVPAETLQHLAANNSVVVPHMLASLSGMPLYREHNILDDLVRRAAALVIDRDLIAAAHRYGKAVLGSHLERYLVDAMRRLVASNPAWCPNQERSRLWLSKEGLFLIWPNAADDVRKLLEADELPGIPKAPETILEILVGASVFEPRHPDLMLWTINPPPGKARFEAARLRSAEILLGGLAEAPAALDNSIVVSEEPSNGPDASQGDSRSKDAPDTPAHPSAPAESAREEGVAGGSAQQELDLGPAAVPASSAQGIDPAPLSCATPPAPASSDSFLTPATAKGASPTFTLTAPMRLAPAVRTALGEIVASLNGPQKAAAACTVSTGVFVPLSELERRRVDPALALRALAECSMVIRASGNRARTVQHDFGDRSELGVILLPAFVEGLDAADFAIRE
jgi:conjugal transfer pilus assembly protein TraI